MNYIRLCTLSLCFFVGGYRAVPFDIVLNPAMDICSATGYLMMISLLMRVAPGGFHMTAPVCSTYTWINRASSGRTANCPLGDDRKHRIAFANLMVTRTILALVLCTARGLFWILEQPALSIMQSHPAFKLLRRIAENTCSTISDIFATIG